MFVTTIRNMSVSDSVVATRVMLLLIVYLVTACDVIPPNGHENSSLG